MSFWSTSTGENVVETATTEYDVGGGFITIPDGSNVLAYIKDAGWKKDNNFNEYINLQWKVEGPEEVKGAVVFQKLWVKDGDPNAKDPAAKRDKALKMLVTIDANAGGKLARKGSEPSDDELMLALSNRPMVLSIGVWEMNGTTGNWVRAVSPKAKELKLGASAPPTNKSKQGFGAGQDMEDDEIPF